MLKKELPKRGQTAIEYVVMICSGRPGGTVGSDVARGQHCSAQPPLARPAPRPPVRGQTAIEYVMMISATVLFISLVAFFVKTRVIAP